MILIEYNETIHIKVRLYEYITCDQSLLHSDNQRVHQMTHRINILNLPVHPNEPKKS